MPELLITPQNCDRFCGLAGAEVYEWDGQLRVLNFKPPEVEYGKCRVAKTADDVLELIPRDQWQERIKEKDAAESWLRFNNKAVACKDQDGLGYCHAYGTASTIEIARNLAGYGYTELSAESIGGVVTGWRNEGADPEDDLQVAVKYGACAASFMDQAHSLSPSRWKDGWEADALTRRVTEFYDLRIPGKTFDAVVTCALQNIPIGLGYAWWGHFVHGVFRVRYNSKTGLYEIEDRNSWSPTYGDDGYFWLAEGDGRGEGTPDWAFATRVVKPSEN